MVPRRGAYAFVSVRGAQKGSPVAEGAAVPGGPDRGKAPGDAAPETAPYMSEGEFRARRGPPLPSADDLLARQAEIDFEEGLAFLRQRLRQNEDHPTLVARAMEGGILAAIATLQLRPRYRDDVLFLLSLAHRVARGEDPCALARANVQRALRMRELALVARVKDPAFAGVERIALGVFEARLPDLARLVVVGEAPDYDHLVRAAFPERGRVEAMVRENQGAMLALVAHVEASPGLLRIPSSWVPSLSSTAREMIEWETDRVLGGVARIYAPAAHAGAAGV